MLTCEAYNAAELLALRTTPNRIIECCQPVAFQAAGYPGRVSSMASLMRYVDVMQERRAENTVRDVLGGVTGAEIELIASVAAAVADMTEQTYGRRLVPRSALLRPLSIARHISALTPPGGTVLEIGPGSGYLGALLLAMGYRYIATDITQAFYLYQSHLFGALSSLIEMVTDPRDFWPAPPAGRCVHVPWWKFVRTAPPIELSVDAVTCSHALAEMHLAARGFYLRVAADILGEHGLFIFEGPGSAVVASHSDWQGDMAKWFEPLFSDLAAVMAPRRSSRRGDEISAGVELMRNRIRTEGVYGLPDVDARLRVIAGAHDLETDDERFMDWSGDPR